MYSSSVLVELPTVARPTGISVQYSCEPGTLQLCDERRFRVSRVYFLPRYRSQSSPSKSLHEDNRRARATLVGPTLPRTGVSHAHVLDPSDLTRWAKRTKDPPFNHSPPNNSPNGKCLFGDPLDLNTGPRRQISTQTIPYTYNMSTENKEDLVPQHVADLPSGTAQEAEGLLKSRFDHLPLLKTLWIFRRAAFYCFISFTWQMLDGWEVNLAGTLVANKGFVLQFGEVAGDSNVRNLNTSWREYFPAGQTRADGCVVSAWSAIVVCRFNWRIGGWS